MKFTYTEHLGFDENGQAITTDYKFLRTINTEKIFKDETGDEFNAQVGEVVSRLASFEQDPTDPQKASEITSLQFIETRHDVLKFLYAQTVDGALVQNEDTRKEYEELDLPEGVLFNQFLAKLTGQK